ncbi:MAG: DoxX family protein [Flavobacteriales bacterium]|nr:DoxX family protein [Flavobacteriales bacterium]|tara:strand:- start:15127 stop:15528 length:402 start_codon:yes stop_codon:yes gene_type:complete
MIIFPDFVPLLFISIFFSILFLQSGIDKIIDFKANLSFLNNHFSKTFFKNHINILLNTIMFLECFTGLVLAVGCCILLLCDNFLAYNLIFYGIVLSNITLSCLFLGQRIAKDYEGAANIVIYQLVAFLSFLFF